ncbi:MAG: FAD-binding protein, partial [Spirochaetia bacterium]|nr:FAD-binding protein [Spirochaetia bacterium]
MDEKKVLEDTGCIIVSDEPMSAHTTFHTGGTARFFAVPESGERLLTVKRCAEAYDIPYYILGGGANVLFPDEGFNGVVISTAGIDSLYLDDAGRLHGGCGASVNSAVKFACDHGLAGLEFFYAMPGSLGGAVYMNAGAYGGEMKDIVEKVFYIENGEEKECTDFDFSYRHSRF